MSLWTNTDANTGAPKYTIAGGYGISANGFTLFETQNLSVNKGTGVYGVNAAEAQTSSGDGKKIEHAGWVLRRPGTGPVATITANNGAVAVNSFISFTGGGTGNTSANATVTVNTAGYIISVSLNNGGSYSSTPTASKNTGSTSNAVYTLTMGGRANRVNYETLVAMGSITGDSDDTYFPDT
jgi:hypothetical protein